MWSYVTNPVRETCGRTCNWPNIFESAQGPEGKYNPVFELHFLAGVISQGLVGYITMVGSSFRDSFIPLILCLCRESMLHRQMCNT
jgi:hypothetical protein